MPDIEDLPLVFVGENHEGRTRECDGCDETFPAAELVEFTADTFSRTEHLCPECLVDAYQCDGPIY